jgi:hypothetical protein
MNFGRIVVSAELLLDITKDLETSIEDHSNGKLSDLVFCHNLLLISLDYWDAGAPFEALEALQSLGANIIDENLDTIIENNGHLLQELEDMVHDIEQITNKKDESFMVNGPGGAA